MTSHNRRNIPHPVLAPIFQDYEGGMEFQGKILNIRESPEEHRLVIAVQYRLNEPSLRELIEKQEAQFTTTVSSGAGRLRESFSTQEDHQEISLDSQQYPNELEIQSFITLARETNGFQSPSWTPDTRRFLEGGITLPEGAILAISDPTTARLRDSEPLESCVVITAASHLDHGEIEIRLEEDLIEILASSEYKTELNRARTGERETFLWPSIYLQAIERAVRENASPDHSGKRWTEVIRNRLQQEQIDTADEQVVRDHSLLYAQRLMGRPMRRLTDENQPHRRPREGEK